MKTKDQNYYRAKTLAGIEKLLISTREELAGDLQDGLITQEIFDECDSDLEYGIKSVKELMQVNELEPGHGGN